jgi:hypothetical protein
MDSTLKQSVLDSLLGNKELVIVNSACDDSSTYFARRDDQIARIVNKSTGEVILDGDLGILVNSDGPLDEKKEGLVYNITKLSKYITIVGIRGKGDRIYKLELKEDKDIQWNSKTGLSVWLHKMPIRTPGSKVCGLYNLLFMCVNGKHYEIAQFYSEGNMLLVDILAYPDNLNRENDRPYPRINRAVINLEHNSVIGMTEDYDKEYRGYITAKTVYHIARDEEHNIALLRDVSVSMDLYNTWVRAKVTYLDWKGSIIREGLGEVHRNELDRLESSVVQYQALSIHMRSNTGLTRIRTGEVLRGTPIKRARLTSNG